MTLEVDFDVDAEEVVIVLDSHSVLKASKGDSLDKHRLCHNFEQLAEEDEELFRLLRSLVNNLFSLQG
jgi:hypothetical protein